MSARAWLALALLLAAITAFFVSTILDPWEYSIDVQSGNLRAEMGDLYPRWVGTRALLLQHRNPYSAEVSHEIQMAYYGHPIDQTYGDPNKPVIDEQRFVYPIYVVFLLAPTVHLNFSQVQFLAAVILAMFTGVSVLLWMDVLRWRPPAALAAAVILLVLSSPQIAQGLRLRQLGLLVSFLLAFSTWCIVRNHLASAGFALALATIKPQMVILPILWFLLWSASSWPKRWPLIAGFGSTLIALAGVGELLLPGWPRFFIDGLVAYRHYIPTPSLISAVLGNLIGRIASTILIAVLLAWTWRNRRADTRSLIFARVLSGVFLVDALALPLLPPFNQALLLLPAFLILRDWQTVPRPGRWIFIFVAAWPWVARAALLVAWPHLNHLSPLPLIPAAISLLVPFIFAFLLFFPGTKHEEIRPASADSRNA